MKTSDIYLDDVRKQMLHAEADAVARQILGLVFSQPFPERHIVDLFNTKPELLKALLELGWLGFHDAMLVPTKWIVELPSAATGLMNQNLWIATDFPVAPQERGDPGTRVFPWPDEALVLMQKLKGLVRDLPPNPTILDLCSGAGTLGIWAACLRPDAKVVAVDIMPEAVALADLNRRLNQVDQSRYAVRQGDLWGSIHGGETFDLIIGDPPFSLRPESITAWQPDDGGPYGDKITTRILDGAGTYLRPGPTSKVVFLSYTLGDGQDRLNLAQKIPKDLRGSMRTLKEERVWRFGHKKVFENPVKLEYLILRLGDQQRPEAIVGLAPEQQARRVDEYMAWIEDLRKLHDFSHLHYVMGRYERV